MNSDNQPLLHSELPIDETRPNCKIGRRSGSAADLASNSSGGRGRTTCYLQHGGVSKSGKRVTRKLLLACSLSFTFMIIEVIGGFYAGSISVMADAAHMFSDVLSFLISAYCTRLIETRTTMNYSFGYHRAETVGALISVIIVCVITGGLVLEAIQRLIHPTDIDGRLMFIIAMVGIGFNLLLLVTLGHDHHHHHGGSCNHGHSHSHSASHRGSDSHSPGHGGCSGHVHVHKPDKKCSGHVHGVHAHDDSPASGEQTGGQAQRVNTLAQYEGGVGHVHAVEGMGHKHGHDAGGENTVCGPGEGSSPAAEDEEHVTLGSDAVTLVDWSAPQSHARTPCNGGHAPFHTEAVGHGHGHGGGCSGHHGHGNSMLEQPGERAHNHEHDHGDDHRNQNLRGAIVHVMGDLLQSVGVAIGGAIIWITKGDPNWLWVDPVCTFIFAISVVWVTKSLVMEIINDLMEAVPVDVDVDTLVDQLECVLGVKQVHDMHVWTIGTGKNILTAHIDADDNTDAYALIGVLEDVIAKHNISHSTVQICSGLLQANSE